MEVVAKVMVMIGEKNGCRGECDGDGDVNLVVMLARLYALYSALQLCAPRLPCAAPPAASEVQRSNLLAPLVSLTLRTYHN